MGIAEASKRGCEEGKTWKVGGRGEVGFGVGEEGTDGG
jgi:hypothetical protein